MSYVIMLLVCCLAESSTVKHWRSFSKQKVCGSYVYFIYLIHLGVMHFMCNLLLHITRSSADADNRLDTFSGKSRSTNMVPFHMLHIVSYCAILTLSLIRVVFTIFVFKKFHDLEMGVKGHSRSLRVVSFDRLCMVSY